MLQAEVPACQLQDQCSRLSFHLFQFAQMVAFHSHRGCVFISGKRRFRGLFGLAFPPTSCPHSCSCNEAEHRRYVSEESFVWQPETSTQIFTSPITVYTSPVWCSATCFWESVHFPELLFFPKRQKKKNPKEMVSSTLSQHVCIASQSRLNKTSINPLWKPLETFTRMIKQSVIVSNNQVMQMTMRTASTCGKTHL